MKNRFTQTRTFLVLFCIAFWMLMFFAIPSEASKRSREFRKRHDSCRNEQLRIQSSVKTWKKHHHGR